MSLSLRRDGETLLFGPDQPQNKSSYRFLDYRKRVDREEQQNPHVIIIFIILGWDMTEQVNPPSALVHDWDFSWIFYMHVLMHNVTCIH